MGEGHLFIIAAPSGTGKTTVCQKILEKIPATVLSISYTTRKSRKGEVNGQHYHFISKEEFRELRENDFFAEWAEVYGEWYGTSLEFLNNQMSLGNDVILDIDTQGERKIKERFKNKAISIFLLPPSQEELKKRLEKRGTDSKEVIEKRFSFAQAEIKQSQHFNYVIVNDNLEKAFEEVKKIVLFHRKKE